MPAGFGNRAKARKLPGEAPGEIAARAVVQLLFATGGSFTIETLRDKVRLWFREDAREERRAAAALSSGEFVSALLAMNLALEGAGLHLRVVNSTVSLLTAHVESPPVAATLREATAQSGNPDLTTHGLEVLACVAFKQPLSQAEIDRVFGADKRSLVVKLCDLGLVEAFADKSGRWRFVTTAAFLRRFGLKSLADLHAMSSEGWRSH